MESRKKPELTSKGASSYDAPEFISIGKIHRAHGLQGEIVFNPTTDFPERIRPGRIIFLGEQKQPVTIATVRDKPPYLLLRFKEIADEQQASALRNTYAFIRTSELPALPEGEYYFHQLIGLSVINEQGEPIGILKEILETGANDVYVIETPEKKEILVAAIPQIIKQINLPARQMTVALMEWYNAE